MFVVIGTVTADLIVFSDSDVSLAAADGFRASNLLFTDAPLQILMGGNGGNSAYALARLGRPAALAGAVGRDPLGDLLVNWLETAGVNVTGLARRDSHATSSSTIIRRGPTQQTVFHHLGATTQANLAKVPPRWLTQAEVLLCTSYPLLAQLRPAGFERALAETHRAGGITALDIGPAIGPPVTLDELNPLLPHVDYVLANTHELARLSPGEDWREAVTLLLAAGARHVVAKQGQAGAALYAAHWQLNAPAFAVEANITAGAGDSFNAGFLAAVQAGWPPGEALRFGNAAAALVVTGRQGVLDAPSWPAVELFLQQAISP